MASNTFSPRRKHRNSALTSALHRGIVLSNNTKHYSSVYTSSVNFGRRFPNTDITARKLAAALWQLRFMDVSNHAVASSIPELSNNKGSATKDSLENKPITVLRSRNGLMRELLSPMQHLKRSEQDATLIGDSDSIVTTLVEELHRAQRSIVKLKAAQKSSLENIQEERQKIRAAVDDLKEKLARERRRGMRMESLNEKLTQKLAEARLCWKQFMARYEEEKKERKEERAKLEERYNEMVHLIGCMNMFLESRGANSVELSKLDKANSPSSDHEKRDGRLRHGGGVSMKMNPHVTREIKGCIEWPIGIPKPTCKPIPLEQRVRTQKSQIQNILRSKS
ncbi:hypothetical protein HN51_003783 [Arachis hypogaea]|uniref:Uncharacterized protein n=1 Tax=Arachis hypogaea TaxID=3818 RepID=A0A445DJQ3_ARAHY|nr:uncharacterized protein DS421_4g110470 [Arachis hypogaea]RYR63424.1 hypothetical protein Ahy_A04g021226 [Arachis hypogaea]